MSDWTDRPSRHQLVSTLGAAEDLWVQCLDQHLPVIDVDGHRERDAERRGKRDEVVRIIERRDVLDEPAGGTPGRPRGGSAAAMGQAAADRVLGLFLPFVWRVVLGVRARELGEIVDALSRQRILRVSGRDRDREEQGDCGAGAWWASI